MSVSHPRCSAVSGATLTATIPESISMTDPELDQLLASYQLGAPVSLEDAATIYRDLRPLLPAGTPLDVVCRGSDRVEVNVGKGVPSVRDFSVTRRVLVAR